MDKRMGKRALSLVLALEMLCAPVAMARTEDPARVREEIPLGEEVGHPVSDQTPQVPVADDIQEAPVASSAGSSDGETTQPGGDAAGQTSDQAALLGGGNALTTPVGETGYTGAGIFYGLPIDYMGRLQNSVIDPENEGGSTWGYRAPGMMGKPALTADDRRTYLYLPDPGRVPDLEFDGFYVYDTNWVRTNTGEDSWCGEFSNFWFVPETIDWSYDTLEGELTPQGKAPIRLDVPGNVVSPEDTAEYDIILDALGNQGDADVQSGVGSFITLPETVKEAALYSPNGPETTRNTLPIVGKWNASSHSEVTTLSVATRSASSDQSTTVTSAYTKNPLGQKADDMAGDKVDTTQADWFQANNTFWIRVDDQQATLDLSFKTYEPYYAYNGFKGVGATEGTPCPVKVDVTFNGAAPAEAKDIQLNGQITTQSGATGNNALGNTVDDPARGLWTVTGIPLTSVGEADGGDPFTKIVVTVNAPDGQADHATTYTFYVERQMAPQATLAPGNTPYGMIDRDTGAQWGTGQAAAEKKAQAKQAFLDNAYVFAKGADYLYPHGQNNQSGRIYTGHYSNCWGETNYDLVSEAIVAYQDRAFADPGVSFKDGEGQNVRFGDSATDEAYKTCVTRTIQLRTALSLTVGCYGESTGDACWYDGDPDGGNNTLRDTEVSQTLHNADGSDVVNLRGLNVLPGIYEMVYTFTDPITGVPVTAKRPLIVLPIPGDVDMDGAVTLADAQALADNGSNWNKSADKVVKLAVGRVFDVSRDGSLTVTGASSDFSALLAGFQPVLDHDETSDYPYLPLPEPENITGYQRLTWAEVNQTGGAQLTLEYLGLERGTRQQSGHTINVGGPFNTKTTDSDGNPLGVSVADVKAAPNTYQPDTFWVGVKLSNAGALTDSEIKDFSFSLVYDDQYVEPAMPYTQAEGQAYAGEGLTDYLYYLYNMSDTYTSAKGHTIFTGMGVQEYEYSTSTLGRDYDDTHYSKVVGDLEQTSGTRYLKEAVFTLRHGASDKYAKVKDGYLMVMAFRLKQHPAGKVAGDQVQLVEMAAGMREFTLVTRKGSGETRGLLNGIYSAVALALGGEETYAYSAQGDTTSSGIYGDATNNLRQELTYTVSEDPATGLIPLGADTTPRETIYNWDETGAVATADRGMINGQYDVHFAAAMSGRKDGSTEALPNSGTLEGTLPPGLTYSSGGRITGTPTMAGTFEFSISGKPYRIVIEQKTIRYYADTISSYYGEPHYRGTTRSADYPYHYYKADLSDRELDRIAAAGKTNNGTRATLEWLLKEDPVQIAEGKTEAQRFTPPGFFARTDVSNTGYVEYNTPVDEYTIQSIAPKSVNYKFVYVTQSDDMTAVETGKLRVLPRPVWVDRVALTAAMTKASIYDNQKEAMVTLTIRESDLDLGAQEGIFLGFNYDAMTQLEDGSWAIRYNSDLKLTGEAKVPEDELSVTITGWYRFDTSKGDTDTGSAGTSSYNFLVDGQMQKEITRAIEITSISFLEGSESAKNYTLMEHGETLNANDVQGTVVRRAVEEIEIAEVPPQLYAPDDEYRQTLYPDSWIQSLNSLLIKVKVEGDAGEPRAQQYNSPTMVDMEVHYNWVSPADKAEGEKPENIYSWEHTGCVLTDEGKLVDQCPYDPGFDYDDTDTDDTHTLFTREMDGWYLCVMVRRYIDGNVEYVKRYSEYPITVAQKPLTLTVKGAQRYYGEETPLEYTYAVNDLSTQDQQTLRQLLGHDLTGASSELELLGIFDGEGCAKPSLRVEDKSGNVMDEYAPVSGSPYSIVIDGAKSENYTFQYTVNNPSGAATQSAEKGSAQLFVYRRPVILEGVYAGKDGEGNWQTKNFGTIYADTRTIELKNLREDDLAHVEFSLPDLNANGLIEYYTYVEGKYPSHSIGSSALPQPTGQAVLEEDLKKLAVSYRACFVPDNFMWSTFAESYFDQSTFDADGAAIRSVELRDLTLTGDPLVADNYTLAYRDPYLAQKRIPGKAVDQQGIAASPNEDNVTPGAIKTYKVSGQGTVVLRPIEELALTRLGKMEYTYGQKFNPRISDSGAIEGMRVEVRYGMEFENDPEKNVLETGVDFKLTDGGKSTTFADRGFLMYYVKNGQTRRQAVENGQTIDNTTDLTVAEHDGAKIFVTGKRGENHDLKYTDLSSRALSVKKKELTVTAVDVHRFYGEPNGAFSYTVNADELTARDVAAGHTQLSDLEGYTDGMLTFQTDATQSSYVNGERYGTYDLRLSVAAGKTLDNYTLVPQNAKIYVYPRPIYAQSIISSEDAPVYKIYSGNTVGTFDTILYNIKEKADDATVEVGGNLYQVNQHGQSSISIPQTLANGQSADLLLTGTDIYNNDRVGFDAEVKLAPEDWQLGEDQDYLSKPAAIVRITGLSESAISRNYTWLSGSEADGARQFTGCWAKVTLRDVDAIYVVSRPTLNYTYGDGLDLSGLKVRIVYKTKTGETSMDAPDETVSYTTPTAFQSYGLYVNYWDTDDALPTTNSGRLTLPNMYRQADTNDHLTIAYTHDTQGTAKPFAANGKALVISAFAAGDEQVAAQPKLLGTTQVTTAENIRSWEWLPGENAPATLNVEPLRLEYTLSATDKTYDGTARTAGTLTLTNLFNREVQTIHGTRATVTDAVFVPIGAPYESDSGNYADFAALTAAIQGTSLSFTTGAYTANAPAPLGANGSVTWSHGDYVYGEDLSFAFVNPNVHYEDDTFFAGRPGVGTAALADYWKTAQSREQITREDGSYRVVSAMPVEVTQMSLKGPDAANYTWGPGSGATTSVTMLTRPDADQGQAAVPYATIQKANRATIQTMAGSKLVYPQLEVDQHTNVVRLTFRQAIEDMFGNNNVADTADEFQEELRFEYALLYQGREDALLRQWAGDRGQLGYQDTRFFGGEAYQPTMDPGYVPDADRIPKEEDARENTVYKGQIYRWAEEDPGFVIHDAAYPGLDSTPYLWYYTVYRTDRLGLPRDTVFYPLVRLSETHNYNPSGLLSGDANVTAEVLDQAQKAMADYSADPENETKLTAAQTASEAVFTAADAMTRTAEKIARDKVDQDAAQAEAGQWPDEPPEPAKPAAAVKSYTQRFDLLSTSRERNRDGGDTEYLVEFLESVWFTDTLDYPESKLLDAVVYNNPTRYYGYFWDADQTARLDFQEGISFRGVIEGITTRPRTESGSGEVVISVNPFDEAVGGHTAKIYTPASGGSSGSKVRTIRIIPGILYARLGDDPVQLTVATTPERPSNRRYTWSSSNPDVASVDAGGLVTFRGEGTAIITVRSTNGKTASITVVVSAVLPMPSVTDAPIFNFQFAGPWAQLDDNYAFRPKEGMTRAQLVELLDLFLYPDEQWKATTELAYIDITTREQYYGALRRLTNAKVVTGIPGGIFAGEQLATRAEFVTMLARMLRLEVPDTRGQTHAFTDVDETTTWAYAYIDAMAKTGVIRGVGGGDFAPSRVLTREEAAVIIARLLTTKLDTSQPGLLTPSDMTPENWSYPAVLRAVNAVLFPD